jgi:GNAT superfamily N-acetyltransferase
VHAYYALAAGSVLPEQATGAVRRNMPAQIPVVILARLAVDRRFQGQGVGRALLKDALMRTLQAADTIGVRAMLIHALDEEAGGFNAHFGFAPSPIDPLVLMMPLKAVRDHLGS